MDYARQFFDKMLQPNVVLYNTMFKGYVENGFFLETLELYKCMHSRDVGPNNFTFPFVLRACAKLLAIKEGEWIHCIIVKTGLEDNIFVGTTLIDMYSNCGRIISAHWVFDQMPQRNVVSWTAIIQGNILSNDLVSARYLYDVAPENDVISSNVMVAGYAKVGDMCAARELFDSMGERDVISWNTLLVGYVENGDLGSALKVFGEMNERNVFSWSTILGGYAHGGFHCEVLDMFREMLRLNAKPNDATLVIVLSASARLGALEMGEWIFNYANNNGFKGNLLISNGLIDMYAKCGCIEKAVCVFEEMRERDLVTWNVMIGGLAMHGHGLQALAIFRRMREERERPDGITFVGILCACTHAGLVDEGSRHFHSMTHDYHITPTIEHYGCMVDLLGRAGRLEEALELIKGMPIEVDNVVWSSLLGACRTFGNVIVAEYAIEQLIKIEPTNPANYVLLSNIYAAAGRWKEAARMKVVMRARGIQKIPGWSSTEVSGRVAKFYSSDKRNPRSIEIFEVLSGLTESLKSIGYDPKIDILHDIREDS
ncbi:hypothetical protein AMTRI_Chr02g254500 [Amborella trichopoda]